MLQAVQTCNHDTVNDEPEHLSPDDGASPQSEEPSGEEEVSGGEEVSGEIEYECSPWAQETRRLLRSLLDDNEIPHAWEGTVVVVPAVFEEQVDELVEAARSTSRSSLGQARATIAYEVSPWSAASQNSLVDDLVEAHIPHEWDSEGDLVVHEDDAEAVEELIEALGEPDGGDELDGIALNDRLSDLFVMADRLCRDGTDAKARKGARAAYWKVENAAVPFGVEPVVWLRLHRAAKELLDAIGSRSGDDEEPPDVESAAAELRDMLRRFV